MVGCVVDHHVADVDLAALRITRDGTLLGRAAWGTRMPVDPGEHVIEASAPGKTAWRSVVTIGGEGDVQTAVVAVLEVEPPRDAPPPTELGGVVLAAPAAESTGLSTRRTFALASAGLGVVALGVGGYYGARAISKHGDPAATCTTTPCSSESLSLNNQAKFAADAATVSVVVSLLALGGAAFLWFGDATPRSTARVHLTPGFRPGHSSLDLSGNF